MAFNILSPSLQSPLRAWHIVYGYVAGKFVRISSLKPEDKPQIAQHLLSLSERDRYLRFGYFATDSNINNYVNGLNFVRDHVFGIYDGKANLVAVAHVAHISEQNQTPFSFGLGSSHRAEFGVSVLASHRGKGYGGRLFNRAVTYARNQGVSHFYIHALTENAQMLRIAKIVVPPWCLTAAKPKHICYCPKLI